MTDTRRPSSTRLSRRAALRLGGTVAAASALHTVASHAAARDATPSAPADPAAGDPFPPEEELAMREIVDTALAETATPGALVGVWYPGRGTWLHGAGIADLATAAPMTPDLHVRIASITKTFTATAVLQLVDEGRLDLEEPISTYVAGVPNEDEITVRHLLAMRSGIANFVFDPVVAIDYDRDPMIDFTPEDALAIIRGSTPDFAPGERVQYSDSNYILLGRVIEEVTGQPADGAIIARVVRPLGLTNTSFPAISPDLPEPCARGYAAGAPGETLRNVTRSNPLVPWTAGAMVSTLADLRVWAEALASGAQLTETTQRERLAWGTMATEPVSVAYGLGVLQLNGLVGHNGGILGYNSWMMHAPEEGATIVVVTNRANTAGGTADPIFFGIARMLFPDRFGM